MSAPSFTPGPWRVARCTPGRPLEFVLDARGVMIADTLCRLRVQGDATRTEIEANAQLCAAAPDLYAALDDLLAQLDRGININTVAAYAALAKARGEG